MIIIATLIIVILIVADQLIKMAVTHNFAVFECINVIHFGKHEIINLRFIENDGASWGIFSGRTTLLLIITIAALLVGVVYLYFYAPKKPFFIISLSLIIAGGIGNLIDRIFRNGKVVDYIELAFVDFPIFNLADICVTVGGALFIIYFLFFDKSDNINLKDAVNE